VAPVAALDEKRPDALDQHTHERPPTDLRFRDEQTGRYGVNGEDVEPRNVIENEQAPCGETLGRVVTRDLHP